MGMSIEEIKAKLDKSNIDSDTLIELTRYLERYQKIEQIIVHYRENVRDKVTNENMEKILEAVEDATN